MSYKIRAAILNNPESDFKIDDVTLAELADNEVLVEIKACGICHMDIEAKSFMPMPMVLGHEGAGIVVETGKNVSSVKPGDHVILSYAACGECTQCDDHQPYHCSNSWEVTFSGTRLDGTHTVFRSEEPVNAAFFQQSSFASHAITMERGLVKIDPSVPFEIAAAIPCGFLTGTGVVMTQFKLGGEDSLIVFGVGAVGLGAIMAAKKAGVKRVLAVDIVESRLSLAAQLGASDVIDAGNGDVVELVGKLCPEGVSYILETTGNARVFNDAIDCLEVGGEMAVSILPAPMEEFEFRPFTMFTKAATLSSVSFGRANAHEMLPKMLEWYHDGDFPVDQLIQEYAFEHINEACAAMCSGEVIKPVIVF